ncbi:hypothetical protein FHS61_000235 [Altererythrobacter atlanticus]|uniref:Uncharacterized protein n=1 Tax=Croceibacterium atlanticum TaxID=1267766 RepID=A0A0F7KUK8_9SPHN|nr:DUF4153 domain-containing protein [Croceibacterium atlanticum]AKH42465.1 hypothetical protein WYH_01424 [Croceibacterium atlanticum]MBB5731242.1 hypothetical protein [Croceibacterium atlanticum]
MVDSGASTTLADWPLRPWLLAGILGLAGLLIHLFTQGHEDTPWRVAVAAFLFFAALSTAFTLEPVKWRGAAIFSVIIGLVMAGLAWRAVNYGESLPDEHYGFAAGVLASLLALPLFQAGFARKRLSTPYSDIHYHVWTDAISGAGALAFTGLAWIVFAVLSELFHLLKIDLLRDLMGEGWFGWSFSGVACGAAFGVLRNQTRVLGTLMSVVLLVLSLLAVPVAAGLVLFLLATALSGPDVLWEATRSATPVLLACAAGAYVLTNAILRDDAGSMSASRIMRIAALVLAAVILPLAVFAAFSMGLRLDQHGLSPERLWGLVAIMVACAFGLGYWVALARGRKPDWATKLREANFHLAIGVCALALLLALPVLDFGAISTRNQLARLESGEVSAEDFDYAALRWEFGEPGVRALTILARGSSGAAEYAQIALEQEQRGYRLDRQIRRDEDFNLRVQPDDPELRRQVLDYLRENGWACDQYCVAIQTGTAQDGGREIAIVQGSGYITAALPVADGADQPPAPAIETPPRSELREGSEVEIRTVEKRYIFVDGKPVGQPLD